MMDTREKIIRELERKACKYIQEEREKYSRELYQNSLDDLDDIHELLDRAFTKYLKEASRYKEKYRMGDLAVSDIWQEASDEFMDKIPSMKEEKVKERKVSPHRHVYRRMRGVVLTGSDVEPEVFVDEMQCKCGDIK